MNTTTLSETWASAAYEGRFKDEGRYFFSISFYNKGTDMKMNKLFNETPGFETPRLVLRGLKLEDVLDYFEFASNPLVTKYTWWENHKTIEDSVNYVYAPRSLVVFWEGR
ncbi:hypothetical protein GNP94_15005 [Paenibacillus campinasensis]|uniref:Uncharacterized protein n=1 Tax=Paenibacillus campinasensis TaxID=66347 RepID=A0ABW9T7X1_9BACL|nr:hypothetical protein [Paenibacillus campinasensis]MUG67296.1 hypothetical protein [Paenibacillus campinasensis]